jgi:hypothetical protein
MVHGMVYDTKGYTIPWSTGGLVKKRSLKKVLNYSSIITWYSFLKY